MNFDAIFKIIITPKLDCLVFKLLPEYFESLLLLNVLLRFITLALGKLEGLLVNVSLFTISGIKPLISMLFLMKILCYR